MDTTRLSIARLLTLDVPLDWQEAVAVAQEVAMLSDVHAAMNSRPSLVSPEHCYITRSGSVELPETTDAESPDAVADVLRALLAGRDAPEALEDLAYGRHPRDMSGELAAFPVGNRRALIAKLATRALAALSAPPAAALDVPAMPGVQAPLASHTDLPRSAAVPPPALAAAAPETPSTPPAALDAVTVARETLRPVLVSSSPSRAPFVATARATAEPLPVAVTSAPPFVANPTPPATETTGRSLPTPTPASVPDLELRRIRKRSAERARAPRPWTARMIAWITWRPAFPDPRVLGGAAIIAAAVVSAMWQRSGTDTAQPARGAASAATTPGPTVSITVPSAPAQTGAVEDLAKVLAPAQKAAAGAKNAAGAAPTVRVTTTSPRGSAPAGRTATGGIVLPPVSAPPASLPRTDVTPREARREPAPTPPSSATANAPVAAVVPSPRRPDGEETEITTEDGELYSASNADVSPPIMRRQHLPSDLLDPSIPVPDDWPFLELLIDQQGDVEQVRLHARQLAPGQTLYRHRMLLAAAKAWQFQPARRNGEPVRYLMRVPLEP